MHVDRIPNRTSPPAYLLRETYREGEKVKKRTLANISDWPIAKIEALRRVLRGDFSSGDCQGQELTLLRSLPHGHVAAALGTLRKLKLDRVLSQGGRQPARQVSLSIAMIVARLLDPVSKLATARLLDAATANCSLGAVLGFTAVDEQELYDASTGWSISRSASRMRWLAAICRTARWCSTTSRPPTLRAAPAHWPSSVTIATAKASCRSCSGFSAPPRDARWR